VNHPLTEWEGRVQALARSFAYPPTPELAPSLSLRPVAGRPAAPRWVWAAVIALALLAGLIAIPPVRAAVVEFLRLGAVRIFLAEPTPTPNAGQKTATLPPPTTTPLASLLDLAGETTLAAARQQTPFPILLPAYPTDLGQPEHVFVQELDGPTVVLVWLQPGQPARVRLSLTQIGAGFLFDKHNVRMIEETSVAGRWALWIDGPHLLQASNGDPRLRRLVQGHVLLWEQGEITYRLETDLPLSEARRVAESLAAE
jgi:hypothetical protein